MLLFSSLNSTPFTVPAVPTGIKIGVAIEPCAVRMVPALALVLASICSRLKNIAHKSKEMCTAC